MIEYQIRLRKNEPSFWRDAWPLRMALRDARRNAGRLFLFAAALITGIAALVAIGSLNYALKDDLNRNARELLGADLVASGNRAFEPEVVALLDTVSADQSRSAEMASMATFVRAGESRLVRLLAISNGFPFYGQVETLPAGAWDKRKSGYALVDEPLAVQYGLKPGDSVQVGNSRFPLAGTVRKFPGGSGILQTFTPSVYISMVGLDSTGLVQFGSRITYRRYYRTGGVEQTESMEEKLRSPLKKFGHNLETVESRKESLGRAFSSVYRFFSMLGFVALILGCIGVASSVHIYAREKRQEVAMMRCLGASGWRAFRIYFIQIFLVGTAASVCGALLGALIQQMVPVVFKDFIPGDLTLGLSLAAVLEGIVTGILVSLLFSALPLLAVRFVPPLVVLRSSESQIKRFSATRLLVLFLVVLFPAAAAAWQTGSWRYGLAFTVGLGVALGLLWFTASGLLALVKRFFPRGAGFVFRHALSGLYRPMNQTHLLLVTVGLGAFILCTLNIIQSSLLGQVEFSGQTNRSNSIMFDIQPDQKDGVLNLIRASGAPVNQQVPIVTCRLSAVKGKSVEAWRADSTAGIPEWALMREYRVTYRDTLIASEEIIEGKVQSYKPGVRDSVFVTISDGFQDNLKVKIGDSLLFDVQGMPVMVRIGGIRKVDWPKDPPNFILVFPAGVLEQAPQTWVAATRLEEGEQAAAFQRKLVAGFPNVSLIDLSLVLSTVNAIFDKVGLVVRFLALFSIITGLVVLSGAVINSRYARMKENILLRTLGARSSQVVMITLIEYAWLGLFAALTGTLLSVGGGFLACRFFFEVAFAADVSELALITAGIVGLTVLIGWWNSRGVLHAPPLQVLRGEG